MNLTLRVPCPLVAVALLFLVLPVVAQAMPRVVVDRPQVAADPYVDGSSHRMEQLGYRSFGPFPLGTNHGSDDVQRLVPGERLHWIETAHFRIGVALPEIAVGGSKAWQQRLRGELETLAGSMPVDSRQKRLDPWLRAHLVALRLERLLRDVLDVLGQPGAAFPAAPGNDPAHAATFFGVGPHLGMAQPFTVLLFGSKASLQTYTAAHHGRGTDAPTRWLDAKFGSLRFAAAAEGPQGMAADDEVLAATLAYHVAHNLYDGYRAFGHSLPAWLVEGLALDHARRISEAVAVVPVAGDDERQQYRQWPRRLLELHKAGSLEPLATLVDRLQVDALTIDQRLQSWAVVHWLREQRAGAFANFVHRMKDPFHGRLRFPTGDELRARQQALLVECLGGGVERLDQQWRQRLGPVRRLAKG